MADVNSGSFDSNPNAILIARLGAMGDVIHGLPVYQTLRKGFPTAKIGWIIEKRWKPLLPEGVDTVHEVDTQAWRGRPFSPATLSAFAHCLRSLREQRYDVSVDLQGAVKSSILARCGGAPLRVGFASPREAPARWFYNQKVQPKKPHIVEQNMELALSIAPQLEPQWQVELPTDQRAEEHADRLLSELRMQSGGFAILNPGAGWGAKQWPVERYVEVARGLGQMGLGSLINVGPAEFNLGLSIESNSGGSARLLDCSIAELIAVTRRSRLFVGGDTGPLHLAAALHIPVIALFGPTDPDRNGPFGTENVVLRSSESKTSYHHTAEQDAGLLSIEADHVLAVTHDLLARTEVRFLRPSAADGRR